MTDIHALIFDLDGVLADTIRLHYDAWAAVAEHNGLPFDWSVMEKLRGRDRYDGLRLLFDDPHLPPDRITQYSQQKDAHYQRALAARSPDEILLPGARQLVEAGRALGLRLAVASSSYNAVPVLKQAGLFDLMETVTAGGTVARPKPAPDIFVWTAGALGVRPAQCLVFEDAVVGVQAARTAGMIVAGVGAPAHSAEPHLHLPDLRDLHLPDLLVQAGHHAAQSAG